jgi:site-specific DNA-methyltransferase (adenine-specific)
MRRFVFPGQVIVDPFMGGGTTGVAALELGATFIGFDVDQGAINTTRTRLAACAQPTAAAELCT